jgi:lipid II:glycine glycyltransferase (peptidoglycan interpeptide bridge formation enzyme)
VKSQVGWRAQTKLWGDPENPDAGSLILIRTVSIAGFSPNLRILYLPKGPLLRDWGDEALREQVLDDLTAFAIREKVIFIKIDPDVPLGHGISGTPEGSSDPLGTVVLDDLTGRGFIYSEEQIQFRNTVLVDLSSTEDDLLARMKQKTRYNIRLAARKGVIVRKGTLTDLEMLYQMYVETALRDGFTIRGLDYYRNVWKTFMSQDDPTCQPLIAEVNGEPVAGVMVFCFAGTAYYLHGMSRAVHRNKMPNYLLQWEAMKFAKALGCSTYDLWGAPEIFDESDSMWGVFRFKRGLGGEVFRTIGAFDLPIRPNYYMIYTKVLPRILNLMRKRGKVRTQT